MNKNHLLILSLTCLFACPIFGQLQLSIQHIPDTESWGVYVLPIAGSATPTANCITGSGQITVVAPVGFTYSNFINHGGTWVNNASVNSPAETPGRTYISFGFVNDNPPIVYQNDEETLLFSFKRVGICPDTLYLISGDDPFSQVPNSVNTNAGNELTVVDFGTSPPGFYNYIQNYAPCAWNCSGVNNCDDNVNPQDTTGTGGGGGNPQDTTGTGGGGGNPQDTTGTGGGGNPQDTTGTGGGGNPQDTTGTGGGNPQDTSVVTNPGNTGPLAEIHLETEGNNGSNDPGSNETSTPTNQALNDQKWFTLSPNPTQGWLHIQFKKGGIVQGGSLKLVSVHGMSLRSLALEGETLEINVEELPAGIYYILLEADGKTLHRERFVKQ